MAGTECKADVVYKMNPELNEKRESVINLLCNELTVIFSKSIERPKQIKRNKKIAATFLALKLQSKLKLLHLLIPYSLFLISYSLILSIFVYKNH